MKLALDDAKDNPLILVPVRLMLSFALAHLGRYDEALHHAEQARTEVDGLPIPSLVSSVLANWVIVSFLCGLDFDRASMERALELEDFQTEIPISFRASAVNAVMLMWTGQLDEAAAQMDAVRRRHLERGADTEMFFVSLNSTLLNLMRGCYREAAEDATDSYERAEQLGGSDYLRSMGLTMRGAVAVCTGREADARADLAAAIDAGLRSRSLTSGLDVKILAELELSLGRYAEALALTATAAGRVRCDSKHGDQRLGLSSPTRSRRWWSWGGWMKPSRSSTHSNATGVSATVPGCWRMPLVAAACYWLPEARSMRH